MTAETFAATEPLGIGITEAHPMQCGYEFLSQSKAVWDFPNQKIYLLKP